MARLYTKIPETIPGDYEPAFGFVRDIVGIDIGTVADPTAIVVIRDVVRPLARYDKGRQVLAPRECIVRQAFRLKLGYTYPQICDFIRDLRADEGFCQFDGEKVDPDVRLFIDNTGVGAAVSHMLDERKVPHTRITITSGDGLKEVDRGYRVSKSWLMTTLGAGIASGELKIANAIKDRQELHQQLANFQVGHSPSGAPTFAAFGTQHDDLVLATAIAYLGVKMSKGFGFAVSPLSWR